MIIGCVTLACRAFLTVRPLLRFTAVGITVFLIAGLLGGFPSLSAQGQGRKKQRIAVSPTGVVLTPGAQQQFIAVVTNAPAGSTVSWSATGGTIASNGTYTAGSSSGTYSVTGTITGTTVSATVSLSIAASGSDTTVPTVIAVSPAGGTTGVDAPRTPPQPSRRE